MLRKQKCTYSSQVEDSSPIFQLLLALQESILRSLDPEWISRLSRDELSSEDFAYRHKVLEPFRAHSSDLDSYYFFPKCFGSRYFLRHISCMHIAHSCFALHPEMLDRCSMHLHSQILTECSERKHLLSDSDSESLSLSLSLSLYLSIYLSSYLSIYLSVLVCPIYHHLHRHPY